jgi:hypothetical protein
MDTIAFQHTGNETADQAATYGETDTSITCPHAITAKTLARVLFGRSPRQWPIQITLILDSQCIVLPQWKNRAGW